jgi:hypothetical protein
MTDPVSHKDLADRLDRGDKRFDVLDAKQDAMAQDLAKVRELVELMTIAKTAGRFAIGTARVIKWAGGLAAALAGFFIFWREFAQFFFNPRG